MSDEAERALRLAVRLPVVLRSVGELSLALGVTALVPTLGAFLFGELRLMIPYAATGACLFALGLLSRRGATPSDLQHNEALVVTVAAFVLTPLAMSVPLAIQGIPWIDALFEAVSGITTTGLSTLSSVEGRPHTFLLARAWMQWVGGLGFVVLSLALVLEPGMAARRLGAPGLESADIGGSMRAHARRVLLIYLCLTGFGVLMLMLLGASAFDAVVHTLAGVSTGGFAPRDTSLAALGPPVQFGVLGLSLLGAVSLPLYAALARGGFRRLRDDVEVRALLLLILVGTALLFVSTRLASQPSAVPLSDLALTAVSAQTTAGFSSIPVARLPASSQALLILSMLIGGSQGSTAGGIKLLRILVVLRLVQWLVARTRLPLHAVSTPKLAGESLQSDELLRAAALIVLFLGVLVASWLPFLLCGYDPLGSLFEVTSAAGTVGLSVGISRAELEPFLKGVLCVNMLLGRLEIFAVLVALTPRTWIGRRAG